jgi:hypothetical protein
VKLLASCFARMVFGRVVRSEARRLNCAVRYSNAPFAPEAQRRRAAFVTSVTNAIARPPPAVAT